MIRGSRVCATRSIAAVVDFSSACVQPYVWEILRSFAYADGSAESGMLHLGRLGAYVAAFTAVTIWVTSFFACVFLARSITPWPAR